MPQALQTYILYIFLAHTKGGCYNGGEKTLLRRDANQLISNVQFQSVTMPFFLYLL